MKKTLVILLGLSLAALSLSPCAHAQQTYYRVEDGIPMFFEVGDDGDTLYIDSIDPAWVFSNGKNNRANWRRYTKLVYNFNKVYPYALLGKKLIERADSTIAAYDLKYGDKAKYINNIQNDLLRDFKKVVWNMSISQGKLLTRLIDREVGKSSYSVIKGYKSGFAAGFWQSIAWLFGQNLKSRYDPDGQDRITEELVKKWEDGSFVMLYYSIFLELPPETEIPEKYR